MPDTRRPSARSAPNESPGRFPDRLVLCLPSFTTRLRMDFVGSDSAAASASKQSGSTTNAEPPMLCSQPPSAFALTLPSRLPGLLCPRVSASPGSAGEAAFPARPTACLVHGR